MIDSSYSMAVTEVAQIFETLEYKYGDEVFIAALGLAIPMLAHACQDPDKAMDQLHTLMSKNYRRLSKRMAGISA